MKKIDYVIIVVLAVSVLLFFTFFFIPSFNLVSSYEDVKILTASSNALVIPPLLEDQNPEQGVASFVLTPQHSSAQILSGKETYTFGYNGNIYGPTIRVNRGDDVTILVRNYLNQETTVHWHGLLVDAENDGGPHNVISPGDEWEAHFVIDQPAATLWYHPHAHGNTGYQVYMGLAGLFLIDDDNVENLNIPSDYGVNDIPLIISDKRFDSENNLVYLSNMQDVMMGMLGNTPMVNGVLNPYVNVKTEITRFRILNGSNARIFNLKFQNNIDFYIIGTDGGLLESSVKRNTLPLSPGERVEILVDLSEYEVNDELILVDQNTPLLTIKVTESVENAFQIPENLIHIDRFNENEIVRSREFDMLGMGHMVNINGRQFNMDRIDEYVSLGELERWTVRNLSMMGGHGMMGGPGMMGTANEISEQARVHPFHVHGTQFLIVNRNGEVPLDFENGWKDTIMLLPGEVVSFIARFDYPGVHFYHCHNLEHSDSGMMGQFLVE